MNKECRKYIKKPKAKRKTLLWYDLPNRQQVLKNKVLCYSIKSELYV